MLAFAELGGYQHFQREDFDLIRRWSSASTSTREGDEGESKRTSARTDEEDEGHGRGGGDDKTLEEGHCLGAGRVCESLNVSKQVLGRMCQRIIDQARIVFMREQLGLEAEMCYYCEESVSPQNALLLGTKRVV